MPPTPAQRANACNQSIAAIGDILRRVEPLTASQVGNATILFARIVRDCSPTTALRVTKAIAQAVLQGRITEAQAEKITGGTLIKGADLVGRDVAELFQGIVSPILVVVLRVAVGAAGVLLIALGATMIAGDVTIQQAARNFGREFAKAAKVKVSGA